MWFVIIGKGNAFFHVKALLSRKFGMRCVFCGNENEGIPDFIYFCATLNDMTSCARFYYHYL